MNHILPDLDPGVYDISAFIIGYALIADFSSAEQNALGNWFITVGQILENNSAWQAMIEQRMSGSYININSRQYKETGNPNINLSNTSNQSNNSDEEILQLKKAIKEMQEQIKILRKKKNY